MQSYNYLANELPRELIEVYNDMQADILRIMVKGLKDGTNPNKIYQKIRDKVDEYRPKTEKVITIIYADSEKKSVKDNKKATEGKDEAMSVDEANGVVLPFLISAMGTLDRLNDEIVINAVQKYSNDYSFATSPNTRLTSSIDKLQQIYKGLAKNGLSIYESAGGGKGKNYSVENKLRRDVMSTVNKANGEIDYKNFKKSSAKFIEVSSHPTARTWNKYMKHPYEDHSSWQGKVYYSREGEKVDGYEEFESTCGYGEMLGIRGINCYHTFQLNYDGESAYNQYSQKEVERQYELSQKQRAYERAIRQLKQSRAVYEEAGDNVLAKKISANIRGAVSHLKDFCEKNNLKYYNWRTQI